MKILSWEKREWVTRLWTLSEGQGNKKCEFQKQGEGRKKNFKEGK